MTVIYTNECTYNLTFCVTVTVKRIRGAYKVHAYEEKELMEKTSSKGSLAEDALKIASGIINRSSATPNLKPAKKDEGKAKDPKKVSAIYIVTSFHVIY